MSNSTRTRAPNFTREEQELLLHVMKPYITVIESKKTDGVKQNQKTSTWTKVTEIYNANTKGVPRTVENIVSCYRNMKAKLKKQHSEAKMNLIDTSHQRDLLNALEINGTDWEAVSQMLDKPVDECKEGYKELEKVLKKQENHFKKRVMGTGGGPPPDEDNNDALNTLRKIIEPQVDGLYTIYDGDSKLMDEFQETRPPSEQKLPIEFHTIQNTKAVDIPKSEEIITVVEIHEQDNQNFTTPLRSGRPVINRQDILKKKTSSELRSSNNMGDSKKNCNETFKTLADAKMELVQLQKKVVEMDLEHKKNIQELELEDFKYKVEIRKKELMLLDLKIKKLSE